MGRILRPKPSPASGGFNAFFYSVVSRDTQELYHANRRQQFLVEQGYNYQAPGPRPVLNDVLALPRASTSDEIVGSCLIMLGEEKESRYVPVI